MSGYRYEKHKVKSVHILGKDFDCREPLFEEQAEYERLLKSKDYEEKAGEHILSFIEKLGVPQEYSKQLPLSEVFSLLAYLRGGDLDKKK